ncbi:MAG: hypothetical protein ABL949_01530 [Fimbriimonadaceae bacterium]
MKSVYVLAMAACASGLVAQEAPKTPPHSSLIANLTPRNVGPTTMGGRIDSIAVYEKDPRIFYIGTACGGIWKTTNGGLTTVPQFQRESTAAIGAVAVSQKNPDVVYVGTGEGTSRNSTSWGKGMFKSIDGGKTWTNIGLEKCRHFHRIVIDPRNDDVVYATGLGDLWGYNTDRGLYKTTDGGKTWNKIWYLDEKTGANDLIMNPKNPNELIMSSYEKVRKAYDWTSGGPGSGIYKSKDAGKTWKKITKGIPEGTLGRIGMDYFRQDPKLVVATIEHRNFKTDVRESGLYISRDGGESWAKQSTTNPRPFYFSIPKWDPQDVNRIYVPHVGTSVSDDQGKSFRNFNESVHVDHHAYWINPNDNKHLVIGEDGGAAVSIDRGATWKHVNTMPIGQFYGIAADMRKPYWVYGGLQDNGTWAMPTQTDQGGVTFFHAFTYQGGDGFHAAADPDDWSTIYGESQGGATSRTDLKGGQGRSIRPNANNTIGLERGERLRFNWSTPFILSPHNSKTLYLGANRVFKSVNRGDSWRVISPDLTTNDPEKLKVGAKSVTPENTGAENHCTVINIGESEKKQGLVWAGTDDGQVWVTENDGQSWSNVTANVPDLPANTWVSRVSPSRFVEGRCYATFDGHRNNDYATHVYVTEDFGKTWAKLNGNLPADEACYVIKEGLRNPDLLFLGTEFSLWVSIDRGVSWNRLTAGDWPTVRVDDLLLHPRDGDLIIGTHGRSIWTMPVGGLEDLSLENQKKDFILSKPAPIYLFGRVSGRQWDGDGIYMSPNTQPGTTIFYYLREDQSADVKVTITDIEGRTVADLVGSKKAGLNAIVWNMRGRRPAKTTDYRVTLKVGDKDFTTSVGVEVIEPSGN